MVLPSGSMATGGSGCQPCTRARLSLRLVEGIGDADMTACAVPTASLAFFFKHAWAVQPGIWEHGDSEPNFAGWKTKGHG